MPFTLPLNYPKVVEEGIATGNLIGMTRTRFVSTVAAAIYHKKAYPTKMEYEHVGSQIVTKYPFMADEQGSHVRTPLQLRISSFRNNGLLNHRLSGPFKHTVKQIII